MTRKSSEILDQCADDVSRENGWKQGDLGRYFTPDGEVCMVGALYRYSRPDLVLELQRDLFGLNAADAWTNHHKHAANWNDAKGRTAGEVADAFRTTAKRLREVGL
jgi:hypothetical protein